MRARKQHFGGVPRLVGLVLLALAGPAAGQEPKPLPERITREDIMAGVMPHKPEILECVKAQRQIDPESYGKGKVVMRWAIQPDGRTTEVTCVSGCSWQFASCVAEKIKSWTFPQHQVQGEALDFPFTF
jgi:hypothetical protein